MYIFIYSNPLLLKHVKSVRRAISNTMFMMNLCYNVATFSLKLVSLVSTAYNGIHVVINYFQMACFKFCSLISSYLQRLYWFLCFKYFLEFAVRQKWSMWRVNKELGAVDAVHHARGFADSLSETPTADKSAVRGVKTNCRSPPIGQRSSESVGRIWQEVRRSFGRFCQRWTEDQQPWCLKHWRCHCRNTKCNFITVTSCFRYLLCVPYDIL